ncbi:hypothetical protein [Methylobacterium sp.]|jgi:hypothetical protein|uniref:hypothetical protein n=1 Tax=Methylobacterium sp. TaxID=409 RepID=UPI0026076EA7|nr:hypothetical protein [Methylobacterium sp.]MDB5648221.1 hypothetical protein [Methylobacterium sp.]
MIDEPGEHPSPKDFDADRNGRGPGRQDAGDAGPPAQKPGASLEQIGAAARNAGSATSGAAREAIERATAPNGTDAGE